MHLGPLAMSITVADELPPRRGESPVRSDCGVLTGARDHDGAVIRQLGGEVVRSHGPDRMVRSQRPKPASSQVLSSSRLQLGGSKKPMKTLPHSVAVGIDHDGLLSRIVRDHGKGLSVSGTGETDPT